MQERLSLPPAAGLAPYEALAVNILIFGLFAMVFNLIFAYAGMLSFGHAALFVGALFVFSLDAPMAGHDHAVAR